MSDEPEDEELVDSELVDEDDAVIGRAFRLSLVIFAVVAAVVVAIVWIAGRATDEPPPQDVEIDAPVTVTQTLSAPAVRFTDVTEAAGIDFVHVNGARGDKLLPETMGGGAAFFDHEGDGDPDLLLVSSTRWPEDEPATDGAPSTMALYRNDGAWRLVDVTEEVGLTADFYGMGAAVGDVDCDGDPDLFVTAVGPNHFFRNDGGVYREVDVGLAGEEGAWSTSGAFFDHDLDGDLDLYVGNYIGWSREIDFQVDYRLTGIGRSYGPPTNFAGAHSYLYRNDGAGRFEDVSAEAGIRVSNPATGEPMGKALGIRPVDVDLDGDVDLFVANDTIQNFFFENQGDGSFAERGALYGVAFDRNGNSTGAMGIDAAWYRNDDALGFAIGNFANEMTSLYVTQNRPDRFADESIIEGIGTPSRRRLSFGVFFFDYDLDGRLDLLAANGHLEDEINRVQASMHYEQPAQLFWNAGPDHRSCFVEASSDTLGDLATPIVGRGATYADVDGDGDLDVLLTQTGRRPLLLRNDQDLGHHWVRISLRGVGCNPSAIGARVELEAGGVVQRRDLFRGRSYLAQVELPLTFGLGAATLVDRVTVTWPDGSTGEFRELDVDRVHLLEQ